MDPDSVDWKRLKHAYGKATDVPGYLRALKSADAPARAEAAWKLEGVLAHQGTRYPASAPAVPFLLELLANPAVGDRHAILRLLLAIAVGQPEDYADVGFCPGRPPQEELFSGRGAKPSRDAYEAVAAGVDVVLPLLSDADARVRADAACLLAWLGTVADRAHGPLRDAYTREDEPRARASLLLAIGWAGRHLGVTEEPRLRAAVDDGDALVRDAAAVALAHLGPLPEEAWPAFRAALLREVPPSRGEVPWWEDFSPLDDLALGRAAPGEAPWKLAWPALPELAYAQLAHQPDVLRVADAMIAVIEQGGPQASAASGALFGWLFGAPGPDELKRRYLVAHALSDRLLVPALAKALRKEGLPGDRARLRAHLGLPPHPADAELTLGARQGSLLELAKQASAEEIGSAVADRPTGEAVGLVEQLAEVAVELNQADATRPFSKTCWEAVRVVFAALASRPDLEAELRSRALPRVGKAKGEPGMWAGPVWLTIGAAALAGASVVPGPWADPMLARCAHWALVAPDIAAILRVFPAARRQEALRVVARIHRDHVIPIAAACCADEDDVRAATSYVTRYGKDSRFDVAALGAKLAGIGPVARPVFAAWASDPAIHWRAVFVAALKQ